MNKRIEEMKSKGNMTEAYILHYIKRYIALKNYPPTFREIMEVTGIKSLKASGKIGFEEEKPRTLHLKEGA